MPPLRPGRASKACDHCRKNKTRCYAFDGGGGTCLRCQTLSQSCSLESSDQSVSPLSNHKRQAISPDQQGPDRKTSTDLRIERLESLVELLVDKVDARLNDFNAPIGSYSSSSTTRDAPVSADENPPPVLAIRDAATDAGFQSSKQKDRYPSSHSDVISTGLVSLSTAHSLLELFRVHYGRWVKFSLDIPREALLHQVRKSPLLLCSVLLISVRQTTQELADRLAPKLFQEAKRLAASSLIVVPQTLDFFQAILILSLWSTTIGQELLSIDSWLFTGYALQQTLASPDFREVLESGGGAPATKSQLDTWCIWNHLCLAHLQYCIGTRRQAQLNRTQIDQCSNFIESDGVTNYEARMAAEVKLYWIIYDQCCASQVNLQAATLALEEWQQQWATLLGQPRAQFLQMGFYFAHLLAHYQFLKLPRIMMDISVLSEMIKLSKLIINIVIDTTDERTRHLTDHIYHTVTFSALTLCRLIHNYEANLRAANYDIAALDNLIYKLIEWLRSIGLPYHAARILADIVSVQFKKLRPDFRTGSIGSIYDLEEDNGVGPVLNGQLSATPTMAFWYPDFIDSELFSMEVDAGAWPVWAG